MKNNKILFLSILLSSITLLNSSCSKEKGCTDRDSINYNSEAEENDGSCQYEGRVVFWYNKATSDALVADGATSLVYYVDSKVVGSSSASVFWTGAPNCGQDGSTTVTINLGGVKNKTYTYSVKDQTGFEYWTGTVNFTANTCLATQLTL